MAIISQKNLFSWKEVEAISDLDLSAVAQAGREDGSLWEKVKSWFGYDSEDKNRELYDRYGIKPVIDIRESWKDEKKLKIKTRPLYEDKADRIVYDNKGSIYCHCGRGDDTKKDYAAMAYMGYESDRRTLR